MEHKAMKVYRAVEKIDLSPEGEILVRTSYGKIKPFKQEVMYQTPPDRRIRELIAKNGEKVGILELGEAVITGRPSKEFFQAIVDHTNAYLFESKEPPAEIATTIKNIADDFVNERELVIKAGDYASLQNYIRKRGGT